MAEPQIEVEPFTQTLLGDSAFTGSWRGRRAVLHYGDWIAEYAAFESSAGVTDLSDRTVIEVTGRDRAAFLHRMCTNRVVGLPSGTGCEAFLADAKGHVVAHLLVFVREDSLVLDGSPGQGEAIVGHLARYVVRDHVQVADRSGAWGQFLLAGPASGEVLGRVVHGELPPTRLVHADAELDGVSVWLRCLEPARRAAWLIGFARDSDAAVWQALRAAGAAACGRLAAEAFRIERGWPEYGADITAENLPQEVARDDRAIAFDKGCYLGQETVARIDSRGHVNRTLVGLKFDGSEVPSPETALLADGAPVGRVTSAAFSPGMKSPVGLGYVRRGHNAPGSRLDSPLGPVEVVALPIRA